MCLCWRSVFYWPQTKVKNINLVLVLGLFLGLDTVAVHLNPVQVHRNSQQLHYCKFESTGKVYNINDLLKCLNELAIMTNYKRQKRLTDENTRFLSFPPQSRQQSFNYYPPVNMRRVSLYPANRPRYYKYPPALPPGYPLTSQSTSEILGINLMDALSSISRYDDLQCVPRIICEVATGVLPGNSAYKQSSMNTGMNALISFLTTISSGDTSPLLKFGKSALMGYANRGNSEICYRQYFKCPRDPNKVVNYLNNHNGGLFRFFNNRNTEMSYHSKMDGNMLISLYNSVSDRKGTGELKFDITTPKAKSKSLKFQDNTRDSKSITFPDDERHFNRLIKSFDYDYENHQITPQKPMFFAQDRMDQSMTDQLYDLSQSQLSNNQKNSDNKSEKTEAKLYLLENFSDQNYKSFIFPDGQSVTIDIGFSKLFNNDYKKTLKRGFIMNTIPQPINFEGLSMINLLELYSKEDIPQYIQVIHPCDMICHDSQGTVIQFNQMVNSHGILSTIMTPEKPIVDLSQSLPCEIICLNRNGFTQQISTTLDKVLRANYHHNQVNKSVNRFKRVPSENKIIQRRFVGDTYTRPSAIKPSYVSDSVQPIASFNSQSFALPQNNMVAWSGGMFSNPNSWINANGGMSKFASIASSDEQQPSLDSVVMGENPLAAAITVEPQTSVSSLSDGNRLPIPATVLMCGGSIFFIPVNPQTSPICTTSVNNNNTVTPSQILYQPENHWGNYSNFFTQFENINDFMETMNFSKDIEETTPMNQYVEPTTDRPIIVHSPIPPLPPIPPIPPIPPTVVPLVSPEPPIQPPIFPPNSAESEILDFEQQNSCLDGESWNSADQQCVPVKYHKDAEYEYSVESTYNNQQNPVVKRDEESERIVIITPDADMYIKTI